MCQRPTTTGLWKMRFKVPSSELLSVLGCFAELKDGLSSGGCVQGNMCRQIEGAGPLNDDRYRFSAGENSLGLMGSRRVRRHPHPRSRD